jgi:hypothetical protein
MDAASEIVDLHLEPNEASDLLPIQEPGLLSAEGWDVAYLTALDEGRVEDSVALLGHAAGAPLGEGWSSHKLHFTPVRDHGRTEDAEALALRDGLVYVVGSHFGKKEGPLQPRRQFIARFPQEALEDGVRGARPPLEVARTRFRLHRAVNDALAAARLPLFPLGPRAREAFVTATRRRGEKGEKRWAGLVREDDLPINVEGAAFRPGGSLLLGLRFPVTADGHPLLVELPDVDALFADEDAVPRCGPVWRFGPIGSPEAPTGVRALHHSGNDVYQLIAGSLDAEGKDSVLLEDHPEGGVARSAHWRVSLGGAPPALVHDFGELGRVEGVADGPGGHALYVVDEEARVDLRLLLLD